MQQCECEEDAEKKDDQRFLHDSGLPIAVTPRVLYPEASSDLFYDDHIYRHKNYNMVDAIPVDEDSSEIKQVPAVAEMVSAAPEGLSKVHFYEQQDHGYSLIPVSRIPVGRNFREESRVMQINIAVLAVPVYYRIRLFYDRVAPDLNCVNGLKSYTQNVSQAISKNIGLRQVTIQKSSKKVTNGS